MGAPMDYTHLQYLDMGKDADGNERKVAYIRHEGKKLGIIKVPGYNSEMVTEKAKVLEDFCIENGYQYVKYEYEGTQKSPGVHKNITYETWFEDSLAVLDRLTEGPQILVGSSLGGWTATLMALARPDRIHSILHLAPKAIDENPGDMAEKMKLLLSTAPPEEVKKYENGGVAELLSPWNTQMRIWKNFYDKFPQLVEPGAKLPVKKPIRFIHAITDNSVPYEESINFAKRFDSDDVDVIIRNCGDHRLQSPSDCTLIKEVVQSLINKYPVH